MDKMIKTKLIGVGLGFCAFSFLYEYVLHVKSPFFTSLIMALDIGLLLLNLFYLISPLTETKKKAVISTFLWALIYFSGISGLIMCVVKEKASLQVLLITLETLVYLGPILILLLPIFYVIAEIFG
ncbi:MAG: hypothetical protein E7603_09585 [Ruminococcaceae bacterium]|nr:hypothetical protein [Oscillospiraceae bacterium]